MEKQSFEGDLADFEIQDQEISAQKDADLIRDDHKSIEMESETHPI